MGRSRSRSRERHGRRSDSRDQERERRKRERSRDSRRAEPERDQRSEARCALSPAPRACSTVARCCKASCSKAREVQESPEEEQGWCSALQCRAQPMAPPFARCCCPAGCGTRRGNLGIA